MSLTADYEDEFIPRAGKVSLGRETASRWGGKEELHLPATLASHIDRIVCIARLLL
jgi:hypothetical protein